MAALAVFDARSSSGSTGAKVTVSPSSGLRSGALVTVRVSGVRPDVRVRLSECATAAAAASLAGCGVQPAQQPFIDTAGGAGSTGFRVTPIAAAGPVGTHTFRACLQRCVLVAAGASAAPVALHFVPQKSSPVPAGARVCTAADLRIARGADLSEKTGQHTLTVTLTNVTARAGSPHSCALDGYPTVVLTAAGVSLPFAVRHADVEVAGRAPALVTIAPGRSASVVVNKYRCDVADVRRADTIVLVLPPGDSPALALRFAGVSPANPDAPPGVDLAYCGPGDPGSVLAVSPIAATLAAAVQGP